MHNNEVLNYSRVGLLRVIFVINGNMLSNNLFGSIIYKRKCKFHSTSDLYFWSAKIQPPVYCCTRVNVKHPGCV